MGIINEVAFNTVHNNQKVQLFTLKNKNGMIVQITNYGATIVSINVKDKEGKLADVVQGYDTAKEYIDNNESYQGAICGRYANRIKKGKFTLNRKEYSLTINDGGNHLHGGLIGFDKKIWDVKESSASKVTFQYTSPDGEEGYPGTVTVIVTYSISENNELQLDCSGTTDQETILNLVNHSYFNLAGEGSGTINNHQLQIEADFYTPLTKSHEPTGEILTVKNTPFDFTSLTCIGDRIDTDHEQLAIGKGYDHNFVLKHRIHNLELAATAIEPQSGRKMEVFTTMPGLQLYTANWIKNEKGKENHIYQEREAFCLETQNFPDAINQSHFPSPILAPKNIYKHSTIYRFSIIKSNIRFDPQNRQCNF
ncbi:aldose epimerase family protein [Chryseobacterium sp. RU33C]|uniref:aldose epimerase family protein n=1 Tax=Chryseobacterium sp. RU33C TaxID=1907398 RepID=UPI0009553A76|nr:aldose epimerase family protein [Chryseobacterium sp. RU33C]SIQ77405.1 aldose 1-epimerase [Chryseobacterium sp. RU33C]